MESSLENKKILVVEDDELTREQIIRYFKDECGCIVTEAFNGKDGLEKYRSSPDFDIVLSDLQMHPMDGIDMVEKIHQEFPESKSIFSILSTEKSLDHKARCKNLPIKLWKLKPFEGVSVERALKILIYDR